MKDTEVSFAVNRTIEVGRFLRKEYPNIDFASCNGVSRQELTTSNVIGLLDANSAPQLNWWQKIFQDSSRRFIGVLRLPSEEGDDTQNKWKLDVYICAGLSAQDGPTHITNSYEVTRPISCSRSTAILRKYGKFISSGAGS